MKYLIIGLGVFGTNLAIDLTDIGHEVIAVDRDSDAVERLKDIVATTYILDTADENSIGVLPLANIDVAIVTIGNNFGASIKTVALLKKYGLRRLMVRATDELHEAILEGMGVNRILTPEKKSALNLVNELALNTHAEAFAITPKEYIIKFKVPDALVGKNYAFIVNGGLDNLKFVAACRPVEIKNIIGVPAINYIPLKENLEEEKIRPGDELTLLGDLKDFRTFYKTLED